MGDFFQLKAITGMTLCKLMFAKLLGHPLICAKALFQKFRVVFLNHQHRASACQLQQSQLDQLRKLPSTYPHGTVWNKDLNFYPVNDNIVKSLIRPLTIEDISTDHEWIDSSVILVTGNSERSIMNASTARIQAYRKGTLLYRWKKPFKEKSNDEINNTECLYDEDLYPTLFGYWYKGAPGQILDNKNGNVSLGIANGTMCRYHSIAWEDVSKTDIVMELTSDALRSNKEIVDLPFPPDFINIIILDRNLEPVNATTWPIHDDLIYDESNLDCTATQNVVVPIGLIKSKEDSFF